METKISLERVIDGGANQGDWSAALIQSRPELRNVVLIEPNKQLNHILKNAFVEKQKFLSNISPLIIEMTHYHLS